MNGDYVFNRVGDDGHMHNVFTIRNQQLIVDPETKTDQHAKEFIATLNRNMPGVCRDSHYDKVETALMTQDQVLAKLGNDMKSTNIIVLIGLGLIFGLMLARWRPSGK